MLRTQLRPTRLAFLRDGLVAAHTNVAVDAALEATASELEARGLEKLLEAGTTLRAGPAFLSAVTDRKLSSRDVVLVQIPDLGRERRALEGRLRQRGLPAGELPFLPSVYEP
jgi:hypothetical protein